ncbi:MAG: NUDIX hydrolase [Saprospiraceae bacterium]|nr:NUDIX hydrolase [Chitinophagia bacterium]
MTSIPNSENINTWISELNSDAKAAISVDCVIFGYNEKELSVLQIECNMPPHEAKMSLIGDLVKSYETVDEAANRILEKITGLSDLYLEQVQTFSDPNRHPLGRVISVAYYSLIKTDKYELIDKEHKHLQWVPITSTEEMAFDHQQIMNLCYNRLKKRLRERPVGFSLLPKKFTLIQLQRLYEIILGIKLDKRNFRRKLKATGLLKDLGEVQQDVSHRPAKLYTFDYERYAEMKNSNVLKFDI